MTYYELCGLLDKTKYEYDCNNIEIISSDVLRACVQNDNYDLANILYFRMQQCPEADNYPELEKLFSLCSLALSKEEKEYVKKGLNNNVTDLFRKIKNEDFDFEKMKPDVPMLACSLPMVVKKNEISTEIISEKTYSDNRQVNKVLNSLYEQMRDTLNDNGHYFAYKEIEKKVGSAIFEEIRYELNPILYKYILRLYDMLLNNSGNLRNKKLFVEACKLEEISYIKILINTLFLIDYYSLDKNLEIKVCDALVNKNYDKLYTIYKSLLNKNTNFYDISNKINDLLKPKQVYVHTNSMVTLIDDLNFNKGKLTYKEASNLYVILEDKTKLINQGNDKMRLDTYVDHDLSELNKGTAYMMSNSKRRDVSCI